MPSFYHLILGDLRLTMGNAGLTRPWESSESSNVPASDENSEVDEHTRKGDETSSTGSLEYK